MLLSAIWLQTDVTSHQNPGPMHIFHAYKHPGNICPRESQQQQSQVRYTQYIKHTVMHFNLLDNSPHIQPNYGHGFHGPFSMNLVMMHKKLKEHF